MVPVERYALKGVKAVGLTADPEEVAGLLAHENVRDVLVVDAAGRLAGILAEALPEGATAAGAMSPALSVQAGEDAEAVLARMEAEDLDRLAVVDGDGVLVGILARSVLERRVAGDQA
jgi:CBS domain-containing protein